MPCLRAKQYAQGKTAKWRRFAAKYPAAAADLRFTPVIFEDAGAMGKQAITFIDRLADLRAAALDIKRSASRAHCYRRICARMQKGNALAMEHHHQLVTQPAFGCLQG